MNIDPTGDCFMHRFAQCLLPAVLALAGSLPAGAQDFPTRPITVIVPYAPGGSTDVLGRTLAEAMSKELKTPVILENVGGAGGTIGTARAAKSAPNGYTLLFHNMGHAAAPWLYRSLGYDPVNDFEPIGLVADVPMILVAKKNLPPKNLEELIAYVKTQKDKIAFAHAGNGSTTHLCSVLLSSTLQTEMTLVPYRGTGPALQDLISGQVDLLCDQPVATTGHLKSGLIKAYAIANRTRIPSLPDVPTFREAGLPGFEIEVWHGLYAPKGTPAAVVERLVEALQSALRDPALVQRFASLGTAPVDQNRINPRALRTHVKAEVERWGPILRKAGVNAE
jgi:tripartite-type tricarboxylate transporter receptor subunit TctC